MHYAGARLGLAVLVVMAMQLPTLANIELCQKAKQGQTLAVTYFPEQSDGSQAAPAKFVFDGKEHPLFTNENKEGERFFQGLLAIAADLKPGTYAVKIGSESTSLAIEDGKFPVQHLSLPKSKDNFTMSVGEEAAVEGAKSTLSGVRLWQGKFVPPAKAPQSARFGLKRVVNGRLLKDYFHSGLDFAAPLGSPVCACAAGKVVLAHTGFKLHGNIVAIDHGQGVISFYIHLQKITVSDGQLLAAGQQIGNVGATGRATGPHLHFSIYVDKTATDPSQWFATAY
jgi:murein DD-endopeptidase MepM/ murein hydrolase activator NlpD